MAMTTSATETCRGNCSDAEVFHENEGQHVDCQVWCRENRFEGRCHCGRKYEKPRSDRSIEANELVSKVLAAREIAARRIGVHASSVTLSLHNVPRSLWESIDVEPNSIDGKRLTRYVGDVGVLIFPALEL